MIGNKASTPLSLIACCVLVACVGVQEIRSPRVTSQSRGAVDMARRWRAVQYDTIALKALIDTTTQLGESGARILLEVVADDQRHADVRLYALQGLNAYWGQCQECSFDSSVSAEERVVSVSPALRDTIRVALATVAEAHGRVGATVAQRLFGYQERWNVEMRPICTGRAAAYAVAREMNAGAVPIVAEDLDLLFYCSDSGPPILAEMWRTLQPDSAALLQLVTVTVHIRDRRLYDALHSIAMDAARPDRVRIAATLALGAQLDEGVSRGTIEYVSGGRWQEFACTLPGSQYPRSVQEEGSQHLPDYLAARSDSVLRVISREASGEAVRNSAREMASCLEKVRAQMQRARTAG